MTCLSSFKFITYPIYMMNSKLMIQLDMTNKVEEMTNGVSYIVWYRQQAG